jgi:hypothetical protein
MVITRFLHAGDAFADVRIWGLSGPLFHRLSGWVFACLILCTFINLARVQWRQHPRKSYCLALQPLYTAKTQSGPPALVLEGTEHGRTIPLPVIGVWSPQIDLI